MVYIYSRVLTLADEVLEVANFTCFGFSYSKTQEIKEIFDSNRSPVLSRVISGETNFVSIFMPLINEYRQLKPFGVFSDSCMTDDFIILGQQIKEEARGLISTEYLVSYLRTSSNNYEIDCDVAVPFSRASLIYRTLIGFKYTLLSYFILVLSYLNLNYHNDDSYHLDASLFASISVFTSSVIFLYLLVLYQFEHRIRLLICDHIYYQALLLDDIVNKIFPRTDRK